MATTDPVEWKLLDTDFTTVLGILPAVDGNLYFELNEPGSGALKVQRDSAIAASCTVGRFIQCNYRGAARGGFFIDNPDRTDADSQEGSGLWLSLSGRGPLAILDDAIVSDDATVASERTFSSVTKASILITLIDEAVARGAISNVVYDFTASLDSESNAWTDTETLSFPVGTTLLDVVRQFADTGVDFNMVVETNGNFTLQAFLNERGSDLSSSIYFRVGTNCVEVSEKKDGTKIKNFMKMKYRDGFVNVSDPTSISAYRRREKIVNIESAQTSASAVTYGAAKLQDEKDPLRSLPIKVYDGMSPNVFLNYDVGDYIKIDRFGTEASERIRGIQLAFNDSGVAIITITLNETIKEEEFRFGRALDWLLKQWNTARDANLMEARSWVAFGRHDIVNTPQDVMIIGNNLYTLDLHNLLIYNMDTCVWTAVAIGYTGVEMTYIGTDIYIGCFGVVLKYDTLTSAVTTIGTIGGGTSLQVNNIVAFGTKLICAGDYDTINSVSISGIAQYNTLTTTWSDIGGGSNVANDLLTDGTNVYATILNVVKKWDGSSWSTLGTWPDTGTSKLAFLGSTLLCSYLYNIYSLSGSTWTLYASAGNGVILEMATYLSDLYVVGTMTDVGNRIARYTGGAWYALEEGLNASTTNIALRQNNGGIDVYVSGSFTTAGVISALGLAAYFTNFENLLGYVENSNSLYDLGAGIHGAPAKTTLTAADEFPMWNSLTSKLAKITVTNLVTALKALFVYDTYRVMVANSAGVLSAAAKWWYGIYSADFAGQIYHGSEVVRFSGNYMEAQTVEAESAVKYIATVSNTAGDSARIRGYRAGGTVGIGTLTGVLDTHKLLSLGAFGYDSVGDTLTSGEILFIADGDWDHTQSPTKIQFFTTNAGTQTRALAMTITKDKKLTLVNPLAPDSGGTGIANGATSTLTLGAATSITGGGTIALGGFTLTVPASLTAAGLAIANVFTRGQFIDGSADEVQLRVQGNSTQTNNIQTWETNGGTLHGAFVGLPTQTSATIPMAYYTNMVSTGDATAIFLNSFVMAIAPGTQTAATTYSNVFLDTHTANNATTYKTNTNIRALNLLAYHAGSVRLNGQLYGAFYDVRNSGTGGVAILYGTVVQIRNNSSGTTDNAYAYYVNAPLVTAGAITNIYGLYISNISVGGTLNYGIYANAATNGSRFGHQITIDGSTDVQQLTITGFTTQAVATAMAQITRNDAAAGISAMLGLTALGSGAAGDGGSLLMNGKSSTTAAQAMGLIDYRWIVATHASRAAAMRFYAYDTAARLGLEIEASGSAVKIGVFGHATALQPSAYTPTNVTTDRSFDANATTLDEVADVLGTLIADLQSIGWVG